MEEKQSIKSRIVRYAVYFLGIIFLCTIISRSVYDYLLPTVSTTTISKGQVTTSQYASGKIGLEETQLKHDQVVVISPMAGKIVDFKKVEGDYVKQGETLGKVQQKVDQKEDHDKATERVQLAQEIQQSIRSKQQKQEKIQELQEKIKEKQEKLADLENDIQIVAIKADIEAQKEIIEKNEALYEAGALSEKDVEDARLKLEQLDLKLKEETEQKQDNLEEKIDEYGEEITKLKEEMTQLDEKCTLNTKKMEKVETQKSEEVLTSPVTGYIHTVNVADGAYVDMNEKLMIIVPEGIEYNLSFELQAEAADKVAVGQKVSFKWAQMPYEAQVNKKGFNEKTGNTIINCGVDQALIQKMDLNYNTYRMVNVELSNQSEEYETTIANSALQKEEGQCFIYGIEEKQQLGRTTYVLKKISVTVLAEGDFSSAIAGNLDSNMKFVNDHLSELQDGQEVVLK